MSNGITVILSSVHCEKDVVNGRIKHCLSHVAGDVDECAVCAGTDRRRLYGAGLANKTE